MVVDKNYPEIVQQISAVHAASYQAVVVMLQDLD
jgi:DNA-binding FrmR family transcriptional regulator